MGKAKTVSKNDAAKPWISNYPPLEAWLKKHNARCLWQRYDEKSFSVECWQFPNGLSAIVFVSANGLGWDIYTSNSATTIAVTLEDAEKRLHLEA